MTTTNKNYLIVGLSIALMVALFLWIKSCNKVRPQVVATTGDSTQYFKNKLGQTVAALKKKEDAFDFLDQHFRDSLAKLLRGKAKEIQSYTQIISTLKDKAKGSSPQIVYETEYRDTGSNCPPQIHSMSDIFLSPYYTIQATLYPKHPDSNNADLAVYDTTNIVVRKVKEGGWFNKKTYIEVDVTNTNPFVTVEGIKYYKIPESKPKRFGLGLQTGGRLSLPDFKIHPYIGAGLSYNFIRF